MPSYGMAYQSPQALGHGAGAPPPQYKVGGGPAYAAGRGQAYSGGAPQGCGAGGPKGQDGARGYGGAQGYGATGYGPTGAQGYGSMPGMPAFGASGVQGPGAGGYGAGAPPGYGMPGGPAFGVDFGAGKGGRPPPAAYSAGNTSTYSASCVNAALDLLDDVEEDEEEREREESAAATAPAAPTNASHSDPTADADERNAPSTSALQPSWRAAKTLVQEVAGASAPAEWDPFADPSDQVQSASSSTSKFLSGGVRHERRRSVLEQFARSRGARWDSAPSAEPVEFDEHAVAAQLVHVFGAASLRRALEGWWCAGAGQAERVALEILHLDPSLATELEGPLRDGIRPSAEQLGYPVPESVMLAGLRLQPGLAGALWGWVERGGGLPESVALEAGVAALRLDPSLASLFAQRLRCGEELPDRIALEVLQLDPGFAHVLWSRGGAGLSEGAALEVLRLDPGLAGNFRDWQPRSDRVALEALRLDPGCARKGGTLPLEIVLRHGCSSHLARAVFDAHPSAAGDADTLRAVVELAAMPLVADVLRFCGPLLEEAHGLLLERFARERSGMWLAMEAGIDITPASTTVEFRYWDIDDPRFFDGSSVQARERAFAKWCHGRAVRGRFLTRGLRQALPQPAAYTIAVLLCGCWDCQCRACRRRTQAAAVPGATLGAALGAADAGGSGAPHALEEVPPEQVQNVPHVEEQVEHSEPAAVIHPEEAARIADEEWATEVERRIGALPRTGPGADGARVAVSSGGWRTVLLEFGRRPKGMYDAIRESDLAVWLTAQGEDVEPHWASGRFVLVEGAEEGDFFSAAGRNWFVAVSEAYEEAVYKAVESLGHSVRPRLKPNGRRYPDSLMSVSEMGATGDGVSVDWNESAESEGRDSSGEGSQEEEVEGEEESDGDGACWTIPVFRTFIHFREAPAWASDRAQSAPAPF